MKYQCRVLAAADRRSGRAMGWLLAVCFAAALSCGDDDTHSGAATHRASDAGPRDAEDSGVGQGGAAGARPARAGDQLADGIVGQPCSSAAQCGSGTCMQTIPIVNVPYPGGYCTGSCYADAECGAEGVCAPGILGRAGTCYLRCDDAKGCEREGYRCRVVSGVGRCIAAPEPLADGVAGRACANDEDCGGGAMSCTTTLGDRPAPGGYCSVACAIHEDCGAGGVCINGITISTISSGRCLGVCATDADCREGYTCSLFGGPTSEGAGACTPALESADAGT